MITTFSILRCGLYNKSMKNFKYLIICAGVALFFNSTAVFALNLREELLFSVVQIVAINDTGDVSGGSGSTISREGHILTNAHVVIDEKTEKPVKNLTICYTISQYQLPKCAATAKVLAFNKEYDVALIIPDKKIDKNGKVTNIPFAKSWKSSGNDFYSVPFKNGDSLPNILDPITVWGYPIIGGSTITLTKGSVSGFEITEKDDSTIVKYIKTDTSVNPGNSGGASFDRWFSFIGIPSNAYVGQMSFLIPVQTVTGWLESLDRQKIIKLSKIDSYRSSKISFSDIETADTLFPIATLLQHLKVMTPYENKAFKPEQNITFGETRMALQKIAGKTNLDFKLKLAEEAPVKEKELFGMIESALSTPPFPRSQKTDFMVTRRQAAGVFFELLTR